MPNSIDSCPIWGNQYPATGYYYPAAAICEVVDSPRAGGGYKLPYGFRSDIDGFTDRLSPQQKARLTTWLIDQRTQGAECPEISESVIEYTKNNPPLAVQERADRLLRFMGSSTQTIADLICLNWEPAMASTPDWGALAWTESTTLSEVQSLLEYLISNDWVASAGQNHYRVTVEGHRRIGQVGVDTISAHLSGLHDDTELSRGTLSGLFMNKDNEARSMHDFFICHASEDKDGVVRQLAELLNDKGAKVWYDEFTLRVGSRLRTSIDRGLADSRFGIVVVSDNFFEKDWPQTELDGLFALNAHNDERILPIWHNITKEEVAEHSPTLADILALDTSRKSIEEIARELMKILQP